MSDSLRILLVDDSASSVQLMVAFLKSSGHELVICMNGQEALEAFMDAPFDLVLMDVVMPLMDGAEATKAMREFEQQQDRQAVPILLLSGNDTPEEIVRYASLGINAFLPKPIDRDELLEAIRTHTE